MFHVSCLFLLDSVIRKSKISVCSRQIRETLNTRKTTCLITFYLDMDICIWVKLFSTAKMHAYINSFFLFVLVPHEIRARGNEAQLAYNLALLEGKIKVCRARLLIIGQDRAGKTSLKNSLMGLPFNPDEPSTEGLEVNSSKLEVSVEQVVEWKAVSEENKEVEQATPQNRCIARLVASHMMEKKETKPKQTLPPEKKEMQEEKEMPQEQVCCP